MDQSKVILLEMKRVAGLATPEELQTLENTPVFAGSGTGWLVTPRPSSNGDDWHRRYDATQIPMPLVSI
jgi:hypothetical protein